MQKDNVYLALRLKHSNKRPSRYRILHTDTTVHLVLTLALVLIQSLLHIQFVRWQHVTVSFRYSRHTILYGGNYKGDRNMLPPTELNIQWKPLRAATYGMN